MAALYKAKVVPTQEPNAEGRWIHVLVERDITGMKFAQGVTQMLDQIPDDHFVVKYEKL